MLTYIIYDSVEKKYLCGKTYSRWRPLAHIEGGGPQPRTFGRISDAKNCRYWRLSCQVVPCKLEPIKV